MLPLRRAMLAFAVSLAVALATAGQAIAGGDRAAVYVQTNTVPNYVQVFDRDSDGSLTAGPRYATGGNGKPAGNPPLDIPFLDSAGSVELSDNGRLLFVVNAGSDTVSSFRVGPDGLELADVKRTFGSRPISATAHHAKLLYVLNSDVGSASISGYTVSSKGELTPIPDSVRPTSDPAGLPAQIAFSAHGDVLAVTERFAGPLGSVTTYAVSVTGSPGPAVPHTPLGRTPFGMAFDQRDRLIVSNEHFPTVFDSTVASYDVSRTGDVAPLDLELANGGAACWTVITNDGRFTYVSTPFSLSVQGFRIGNDGSLAPVGATSLVAQSTALTLDEALSHDSKYFYVLVSDFFAANRIETYAINPDGTLTPLAASSSFEGSASGLAAW
jgi:6-phosphogluconolactonase